MLNRSVVLPNKPLHVIEDSLHMSGSVRRHRWSLDE